MKLTLQERKLLMGLLPRVGSLKMLKQIREFKEKIYVTQQENVEEVSIPKEFDIPYDIIEIVRNVINVLDEREQLSEDYLPIVDKFLNGEY